MEAHKSVVRFDLVSIGDQSRQALTRGTNQRKRLWREEETQRRE